MYVEIRSKSEIAEDSSRGETARAGTEHLKMQVVRDEPQYDGQPPWHIEVHGRMTDDYSGGDGSRGGDGGIINRTFKVNLFPEDLGEILRLMQTSGLLALAVDGEPAPKASAPS